MRKLWLLLLLSAAAQAQFLTVSSSHLTDSGGIPVNGRITFTPHSAYELTGSGQATFKSIVANVNNGVFAVALADTTKSNPLTCYDVYVTDVLSRVVLGNQSPNVITGYQCVQTIGPWCAGGICNFDIYPPNAGAEPGVLTSINISGDATVDPTTGVLTLSTVNTTPGLCGDATHVCQVTTDRKGRVLTQTPVVITGTGGGGGTVTSSENISQFFTAQLSTTIAHNLSTIDVITTCFDASDNQIQPGSLTIVDANHLTVTFSAPTTGRCVVDGVHNYGQSFTAQTSVSLAHNGNTTSVVAACYDDSSHQILPGRITVTDANHVTAEFLAATSGRCVVNTTSGNTTSSFTAQTATSIAHGLGTSSVVAACYDTNGFQLQPGSLTVTDANHLSVVFSAATSGRCVVDGNVTTTTVTGTGTSYTFSLPLQVNGSNLVLLPPASSSVDGYLSHTDWSTFNGKLNALSSYSSIVALFGSGSCTSGYLKWNGTCDTPAGGSGGGVTSINGETGELLFPTVAATGLGTTTTGTTTIAINTVRNPDVSQPGTLPSAACGGGVYVFTTVTSTIVPQAGLGGNFVSGCWFSVVNGSASTFTVQMSGGGGSTVSLRGATGGTSTTIAAGGQLMLVSNGTNYYAF